MPTLKNALAALTERVDIKYKMRRLNKNRRNQIELVWTHDNVRRKQPITRRHRIWRMMEGEREMEVFGTLRYPDKTWKNEKIKLMTTPNMSLHMSKPEECNSVSLTLH